MNRLRIRIALVPIMVMIACSRGYNARTAPLRKLVKELSSRPMQQIKIEKEGFVQG